MARPKTRDDALAEALLRSAVAMVDAGESITTRRVAQRAGTNVAALDQLFGGKAGLMRAVALAGFDQLAAQFGREAAAGDGGALVRMIARSHREFVQAHPQLYDLMVSVPVQASDARRKGDLEGAIACRDLVVKAIHSFIGGSEGRAYDAAVGLTAVLEGLAVKERQGLLGSTSQDCDRIWVMTTEAYLAGLTAGVSDPQ